MGTGGRGLRPDRENGGCSLRRGPAVSGRERQHEGKAGTGAASSHRVGEAQVLPMSMIPPGLAPDLVNCLGLPVSKAYRGDDGRTPPKDSGGPRPDQGARTCNMIRDEIPGRFRKGASFQISENPGTTRRPPVKPDQPNPHLTRFRTAHPLIRCCSEPGVR